MIPARTFIRCENLAFCQKIIHIFSMRNHDNLSNHLIEPRFSFQSNLITKAHIDIHGLT